MRRLGPYPFDGDWEGEVYSCIIRTPYEAKATVRKGRLEGSFIDAFGNPVRFRGRIDAGGHFKGSADQRVFEGDVEARELKGYYTLRDIPIITSCRSTFRLRQKTFRSTAQ